MIKEASYLFERNYVGIKKKNGKERDQYWKEILGEDIFDLLLRENRGISSYLKQEVFELKETKSLNKENYFLKISVQQSQKEHYMKLIEKNIYFPQFYINVLWESVEGLKQDLRKNEQNFSARIFDDYAIHLATQVQAICMRTLIAQMNLYKQKKLIKGENSRKEYEYFCDKIVATEDFMKETFKRFPVLRRCMKDRVENLHKYYIEVIDNFHKDKEVICERFSLKKNINKIVRITGESSDLHHQGKQVLKITFDSGETLFYKPRSMRNEETYQELLNKISESIGITQYEYFILSYKEHSWCSVVKYESCTSREQLEEYYRRLGVQFFATYLLGTKDLHCENVIAAGQYPVLIDLEALIHMQNNQVRKTAEEEVKYQVSQSVLLTGLLPFYIWNQEGEGINISAISGREGQEYPFRVPVVDKCGTSEMCISYKKPLSQETNNLAKLGDGFIEPSLFLNEIIDGFSKAYQHVAKKRGEYRHRVEESKGIYSRILVADTQRYSMMLSASYHPDLMRDGADREMFLYSLWKGRNKKDKNIIEAEVKSLLFGDIPYFYVKAEHKALFCGDLRVSDDYFRNSIKGQVFQKLDSLCENDEERQCEYIRVSLELSENNKEKCMNKVYFVDNAKKEQMDKSMEVISQLTERLLHNTVWNQERTEVNWAIMKFPSKGFAREIKAMNMYLYDGLAGMLLIMYALKRTNDRKEITEIFEALQKQLYNYTSMSEQSLSNLQTRNTGAYNGESSIVYTYLLLYEWSNDRKYLYQAQKHANIVMKLLDEDVRFDLIAGNAGAAQVFLKLYEIVLKPMYLDAAIQAVEILQKSSSEMRKGIGWRIEEGILPMAGMAHGNSGVLVPVISLWEITGEEKYKKLAEKIWLYEDSLYDLELNNWVDVRQKDEINDNIGAVAWCHGSGGILLARAKSLLVTRNLKDDIWKENLEKDMRNAYKKLECYWQRDSGCLCHGSCGNLWILEMVNEITRDSKYKKEMRFRQGVEGTLQHLLPQEKMNPGIMSGYGGILYWLLQKNDKGIPYLFI